jgi:hypothetical protein
MRAAWRALLLGGWSIFVCVACGVPEDTLEALEPEPDTSLEAQSQSMALDPAGRGMLAYYTFDGGQVGTQTIPAGADFSGSNRVAGKYGLVDLLQVNGRAAASFGGSGCFTTNAVPLASAITTRFEVSALVCPTGKSAAGNTIVNMPGMFSLSMTNDKRVRATITDASGVVRTVIGNSFITVNPDAGVCYWQQVGAAYDGSTLTVFFNGRPDGSASVGTSLGRPTTGSLSVGGDCTCGTSACLANGWKGGLDDVKISKGIGPCSRPPNKTIAVPNPNLCSGWYDGRNYDTFTYENVIDDDNDGIDDCVEEQLVDSYAMQIWRDAADSCAGPINPQVRVCRTWLTGQYSFNPDTTGTRPSDVYKPHVTMSCAVLYQSDCGALGHTADVEPYQISFEAGSRSDRNLANWRQRVVTTEAHQGTPAEKVDICYTTNCTTILAARNKHGNYQSPGSCNGGLDSCGTMLWNSSFRNLELGERNYPRISNLGAYNSAWAGQNPWSGQAFLGGGAGSIQDKMQLQPRDGRPDYSYNCPGLCSLKQQCCTLSGKSSAQCTSEYQACIGTCRYF